MKYPMFPLMLAALAYGGVTAAGTALFETLDRDRNDYLTLDETQTNPQVYLQFSQLDRNQNDRLEAEELQLLNAPLAFSDLDIDQSLGISPDEASALRGLQNQFSRLDRNEDLVIDPAEFAEFTP